VRRRGRAGSDPQAAIGSLSTELPGLNPTDRQHFIFYQDEGGYRATDDANQPMDTIYYLGVIDITTPYNALKKAEHFWKGMRADGVSSLSVMLARPYPFFVGS
jgi:1-phosphatidylinositol-4-phosphate 5-kinase